MVTITRSGYIKRTHVEAYRSQRRGGKGVTGMETKEEDIVEDLFIASTHSFLLFFTTLGRAHWLKVHEIPEGGRAAKGKAMVNLLSLGEGEQVATCVPVRDFTAGGYVFFVTRQGKVKKTELEAYSHPRAGGIQAVGLEDGDQLMTARRTDGRREMMIATKLGMAIRFAEEEVRPMGRGAAGVRGIEVEDDDQVIAADVVAGGRADPHGHRARLRQADAARGVSASGPRRQGDHRHQDRRPERHRGGHAPGPER